MKEKGTVKCLTQPRATALSRGKTERMCSCTSPAIQSQGYPLAWMKARKVEFEVTNGPKGLQATNVALT